MVKKSCKQLKAGIRPKAPEWDDSAAVDAFLAKSDHPLKAEMQALRRIILSADPRITEGIKWNSPSCYCHEWFVTFNRSPRAQDFVQLIFHRGAKVKAVGNSRYVEDPAGILQWITHDRCSAKFSDLKEITAKQAALKAVVAQWVNRLSAEAGTV